MDEPREEARHPIGVVAERTGLSPDVLRAWEKRYEVVRPGRDAGGQRLYSDADVERLRLLRRATEARRSIARVARLPQAELERLVQEDASYQPTAVVREQPEGGSVELGLAEACYEGMDAEGLEALLRRWLALLGLPAFVDEVAGPMMRRVGDAWHGRRLSVAQEHLATATLERVLGGAMSGLTHGPGAPVLVVGTPAGERHALGALLAASSAAAEGWWVVYLGADLPVEDLVDAARRAAARAVALSMVRVADRDALLHDLSTLRSTLPAGVAIWAGGAGAEALQSELGAMGVDVLTLQELRAKLRGR